MAKQDIAAGAVLHGFKVERVEDLPELRASAALLRHQKSGARLLHLLAEDQENLFAAAFRTPPPDDTGLPHILEHTVLCGSSRYPVKDPFVELLRCSLATFLNAMTYPDKTVYPCASMVERDFFNLAGVYCDAVFHPLLTENHFRQEGHHLDFAEPGNPASPLLVKGIVYNEMKGAYSDLDGTIDRWLSKSICPDTAYGRDSGGDPDAIPSLTYEAFTAFHQRYYHPSNAFIFAFGGIALEKHCAFLDPVLSQFDAIEVDTAIASQPRWLEAVRRTIPYPVPASEADTAKAAVTVSFLTNDATDSVRTLALHLLENYLLGHAGAPLRKALIDSKLGEELTHSGYQDYQRDTSFTVGLKGCDPRHATDIEELTLNTLGKLVREGFNRERMESSFHQLELASREISGQYPLQLMDRAYRSWLYDSDPLRHLRLGEHLAELRRRWEAEPRFLEKILEEQVAGNPHYSVLTFVPDAGLSARRDNEFSKRMAAVKAGLEPRDLLAVDKAARQLEEMQSSPNSPEALATLPRLAVKDVPPDPHELSTSEELVGNVPLLRTDMFANGLNYLDFSLDISGLAEELFDYLPLFADALHKMGAAGFDYAAMAEREAACSGGVGASLDVSGSVGDPLRVRPFVHIHASALDSKFGEMLGVLSDRALRCDFSDLARLKDVVLQARIGMRSSLVPSGSHYASLHAARNLSRNAALSERICGVTQIRFMDKLARDFDTRAEKTQGCLEAIRDYILNRSRLTASFVGSDSVWGRAKEFVNEFASAMPERGNVREPSDFPARLGSREGLATAADVAFVAKSFPIAGASHPDAPALQLLSVQLRLGYLWDEIRSKRGAYGVQAGYDQLDGIFTFSSYRDPHILETLHTYAGVFEHVRTQMDLSPEGVEQAIIGTVKTMDRPIRPGQAGMTALIRKLRGLTPQFRKQFRRRLLSLSAADIHRCATQLLEPGFAGAPVCVLSSREKLEAANKASEEGPFAISDI